MILNTISQSKTRFETWMFTEEGWEPDPIALVAASLTLAKENGIAESWPVVWPLFITAIGVPDDDTVVLAAVTQNMSEALLVAEFEQKDQFLGILRNAVNQLPTLRRKLSTRPVTW